MMNDADAEKLNGPQQIRAMERLTQQAAGWLLGISARAMRDHTDLRRNTDGSYDARELVGKVRGELNDDDMEKVMKIVDHLSGTGEPPYPSIIKALRALHETYGDAAYVAVMGAWIERFKGRDGWKGPTDADLHRRMEEYKRETVEDWAKYQLKTVLICEKCQRLRRGRTWIKGKAPVGYVTQLDLCPDCDPSPR